MRPVKTADELKWRRQISPWEGLVIAQFGLPGSARLIGMALHVVRLQRGGPWDWSRDMREQEGWDEHARFMDDLVDDGFILLGGPLEGDRDTLHIVEAESEEAIRARLATDPWARNGMLRPVRIERWTVLLDGRG